MEVSALKYQSGGGIALAGRSPLLRLQSDERLITAIRRGNTSAFEVLVARYHSRLLSFCRHMLGSREDAEDVLQEVMAAAFNAIVADERPIQVRPWLYRIARNRSLNHLRKRTAIGVDTMDTQLAEHGATTADKVGEREEFRMLVGDIQDLPETQRTALVLREMDALSYEQIAEAMETTVSSVKSLLVRARVSLAEAAEARLLSCEEVRIQLAEIAEGLQKRPSPLVRRHLKDCKRCAEFKTQLKANNKALAALLPVGPFVIARKLALLHFGHGAGAAGASSGVTAAGGTAATGAAPGAATAGAGVGGALAGSGLFGGGSMISAGLGAVATKAAAGLAAAAVVTAVAVDHHHAAPQLAPVVPSASAPEPASVDQVAPGQSYIERPSTVAAPVSHHAGHAAVAAVQTTTISVATSTGTPVPVAANPAPAATTTTGTAPAPGRVQTQTDPTVLPPTTTTPAPPIGIPVATTPTTTTVVATPPTTVPTTPVTTPTTPTVSAPTAPDGTTGTPPATPVTVPPTPVAVATTPVEVATTPTTTVETTPTVSTGTVATTPTVPTETVATTPITTPTTTTPTVTTTETVPALSIATPAIP